VTWRLLQLRRAREVFFRDAGYTPVRSTGERAIHALAYARRLGKETVVAVIPRLMATLGMQPGQLPVGPGVWGDTRIDLPFVEDGTELRDALTGEVLRVEGGGLAVGAVLAHAPVAVLATPPQRTSS